jgi:hypothetical protein
MLDRIISLSAGLTKSYLSPRKQIAIGDNESLKLGEMVGVGGGTP